MDPKRLLAYRLMAPAGDNDGGGGSDAVDRGDDFEPTDDDDAPVKDDPKAKDEPKAKADGEDDGDEEGDDEEGKGGDKKKPGGIPWSRHKDIVKRERERAEAAERELAHFKNGDKIKVMNDEIKATQAKIDTLDAEYAQLITDGKNSEAAAKAKEIRALERELTDKLSDVKSQAAEIRAVERVRYENTVEKLEAAYPVINPDHADYDEEVTGDVLALAETYNKSKGMTPAQALQRAAEKMLGTATKKQEEAVSTQTRVSDDDKAKAVAEERRKAQLKKNLDVKDKQPPSKEKIGADHDKAGGGVDGKSVMQMKYDDFVKLDEETLSRLRGDVVAG